MVFDRCAAALAEEGKFFSCVKYEISAVEV